MSICARCNATPADFFSSEGEARCRPCFAVDQQRGADARAQASLADTGVAGVRYSAEPQSSKGAIRAGVALMAVGAGMGLGFMWLTGKLFFWFILIVGAGFVSLARGLALRRR
jgi:hypothetical protein